MSSYVAPTGTTGLCAVIGDPVTHSLSPRLHNAAYGAMGIDLVYVALSVRSGDVSRALQGMAAMGFVGCSVTTPLKDEVAERCDQRSATVERLGAANTVVFHQGISIAHSTDGAGLLDDLAINLSFDVQGERCAVLGAGGAARAVILALAEAGAKEVLVVNRTGSRAATAAELAGERGRVATPGECESAALVINATSVSLSGDEAARAELRAIGGTLGAGQIAYDLVYHPARTEFLEGAASSGATVRNGLGMLVHQAGQQIELFSGTRPDAEVLWRAVEGRPTS